MVKKKKISKLVGQYPVVVREDEAGGYWVECPVFDGCYSQGETIEESLANIKEAIALCLEDTKKPLRIVQQRREVSLHLVTV